MRLFGIKGRLVPGLPVIALIKKRIRRFMNKVRIILFFAVVLAAFPSGMLAQEAIPICKPDSSCSNKTAAEESLRQATQQYIDLVKILSQENEISFPFETKQFATKESKTVVEQILTTAMFKYVNLPVNVFIEQNTVTFEATLNYPAEEDRQWSRRAFGDDLAFYNRKHQQLRGLQPLLETALKKIFVQEFKLNYRLEIISPEKTVAVVSVGGVSSRDIIAEAARPAELDYAEQWNRIKEHCRKSGMSVYKEEVSDSSRFSFVTPPRASEDADWLYQSYHQITMWDPYSYDPPQSKKYLNVEVIFIVKRRKQGKNWDPGSKRSGRDEDGMLDGILKFLRTR
jgi:hypothetical protein